MNSPLRVLVVEDNEAVAATYAMWIKTFDDSNNITVETVGRYGDAVRRMEDSSNPKIDVVLLDLMLPADPLLPNGSGLAVVSDMRDRWWAVPIIVISAAEFTENEVLHHGACDYLLKGSFTGKDLVHIIRKDWVRRDAMCRTQPVINAIAKAEEGLQNTDKAIERTREVLLNGDLP